MKQPWVHGRAIRGGLVHIGNEATGALCGRRMRYTEPDIPMPTCNNCRREAQRRGGVVYLIHFDRPYQHARHYMGWTTDLPGRLWCHSNYRGARLMSVITDAGITWKVVALYYGDRNEERRMKNHGHARRCPECRSWESLTVAIMDEDNEIDTPTASGSEIEL